MQLRWCLTFLVAILFFDCYLLFFHQISFLSINANWLKNNFETIDSVKLLAAFTLTFAMIVPGVSFVLSIVLGELFLWIGSVLKEKLNLNDRHANHKIDNRFYVHREILKEQAAIQSNTTAYCICIENETKQKEAKQLKFLCQSTVTFLGINYLLSSEEPLSITQFMVNFASSTEGFLEMAVVLLFYVMFLYVLVIGYSKTSNLSDYIYLPGHNFKRPSYSEIVCNNDD